MVRLLSDESVAKMEAIHWRGTSTFGQLAQV